MLHHQQKYSAPPRPEAMTPQRAQATERPTTKHFQSPAALKENSEYGRKSRQRASPIRNALQDVQLNQYDSVMANSRLEEIRRKYDNQLKRFQEPHTPMREGMMKKREEGLGIGSEQKAHSISRSSWDTKEAGRYSESIMGSASKPKESDALAEQVREIRRSLRADEERGRSASRASTILSSEIPNFGRSALEDPRVESIDKINMKIKQILNCLNENDKQIGGDVSVGATNRYVQQPAEQMNRDRENANKDSLKEMKSSFLGGQSRSQLKISQSFISPAYQQQQDTRQSFISKPPLPEKKEDSRRHSMYAQKPADGKFERAQSVIPMKSSMMIGKRSDVNSSVTKTSNGQYILSSGKDLDEEIRKIQEKIKRSEEEKRRLDIKFESRYQQLAEKKKVLPVTVPPKEQRPSPPKNFESIDIPKLGGQRSAIRKNLMGEESPSFKQLPVYKEEQPASTSSSKQNDMMRSVLSRDRLASPAPSVQVGSIASVTKFSLGGKESSGAKESGLRRDASDTNVGVNEAGRYYGYRRPVPEVPKALSVQLKAEIPSANCVETKRLVDHLRQQVAYDEQLRNSKLNFSALQDPTKWNKLSNELTKLGISLNQEELKLQFELSLQQHNPFYSVRETQQPTDSVAKKYSNANEFWQKKICRGFDRGTLERQAFRQDRVDLERKGYLTVEDFVRFLNIETGTFYRNRDLILIFRRLSAQLQLSFDSFMKTVCR